MDPPSAISRHHQSISSRAWKEAATSPPLPRISITIANFPWKFDVYASNGSYVTFEDVINKIYSSLRKNITGEDFATVSSSDQNRATRAYEQRYRRQRSKVAYDDEKRKGMKRVDFLMGYTRFGGLYNNSRSSDQWQLSIT
ncbi:hypothetical protein BDN70DRAFT_817565 [Pholiota conissans]|uniref:DUF6699 domain-containing protein n=1 Tax=Pholiota conissans TaxID=109636 RepID=A0A9P5YT25_9AGAR|nr:hypothetical protein BDN70DRAFT_817565 [Pholiota conissans]